MTADSVLSIRRRTALRALAGATTVGGSMGVAGADRSTGVLDEDDEDDELGDDDKEVKSDEQDEEGELGDDDADVPQQCDFGAVVEETMESVATIRTFDQHERQFVQGSGWVFDREDDAAIVATNWHVIFGALGADVRFADGDWRPAGQLLGEDRYSDIAVFRVEDAPASAVPMSIEEAYPDPAAPIAVLGTPMGLERTVTTGVVSAVDRSTTVQIQHLLYTVPSTIQIDAATNPGNSGGPVVDCDGRIVGVQFAGIRPDVGQNINFAVSASMLSRVVPELVETGRFDHPYLGIAGLTTSPMLSRQNDLDETIEGVYVDVTVDGFPGELFLRGTSSVDRESGLPIGGDVILAADDTDIDDTDTLRNYLFAETRPEETIELTILRHGDEREIPVTLDARPDELESIAVQESTM